MWYSKSWAPLLAFLVLAFAGGYALFHVQSNNSRTLYHTQLAGCKRANGLRAESNARAVYSQRELTVLRDFLSSARSARQAAYKANHQPADKKAALAYGTQIDSLKGISFKTVPIVDCNKAVLKP